MDQIVREDMSSHQSRSRRLSSTQASNDSSDSLDTYLVADCGLDDVKLQEPWHVYYHIRGAVYSKLSFRHKQLFKLLDLRFSVDMFKRRPCVNKRMCIVGAGPVGLRAAIELALLGGSGISRSEGLVQEFLQIPNVLSREHTDNFRWFYSKWCSWWAKNAYSAIGIKAIVSPSPEDNGGNLFYNIKTEPQIPVAEYTAVHGATGTNDTIAEPAGITRFVFSWDESLGIACYFLNRETTEEMKRKEFSWTTRLKHHMLDEMRDVGIALESIVYSREDMQYLIMTPKRHNLLYPSITTL
ncbi:hypothetical protein PI126_g17921 [Phytophthora idaei]|nr:hypothetical protein PI126_g17921 [Phytophthora idaei]